jgi:hypothetical protein
MRCGTTWTYGQLAAHPSILRAWRKEVHFFDREERFSRGPAWYRAHFPHRGAGQLTGEATPSYMFVPAAAARLAALVPDARLIALLRDPVNRAYSQYHHEVRRGHERRAFGVALDAQVEDAADAGLAEASYLARGRYAEQLTRLFSCFPRDQVLVLRSEALFERPAQWLGRLFGFLGLSQADTPLWPRRNVPSYEPMPAVLRERLVEYFRPHNERLYELLGSDLGWSR